MIPKKQLYADIEKICAMANAVYGCYTGLHRYDSFGQPAELPAFVEKAQALMGDKAAVYLYNAGILRQQQGGQYDFNFPADVVDGGGMSYDNIGSEDGFDYRMAYFFDDKDTNDRHNIYHELGHLMQFKLNMFNAKEINRIYRFIGKGASKKKIPKSEIARRFVTSSSYTDYLLEAHANAFANACLLLRTNGRGERIKQSLNCYLRDGAAFFEGLKDGDKDYPGMKYYSSLPVQKAVIREVNRWFKTGEISKYKDAEGEIDFDAVALKMHDIVMEKAYSPRTFKQFLDMDFTASHPKDEQGWRHSVPEAAVAGFIRFFDVKAQNSLQERADFHEDIDLSRRVPDFKPLPEKDEAAVLLNLCCRLDNAVIDLHNCAEVLEIDIPKYDELDLDQAIAYGGIPDSVIRTLTGKMMKDCDLEKEEVDVLLKPYQENINKLLSGSGDKELLTDVMGAMNRPECRDMLWNMYYDRLENPQAEICPDAVRLPLTPLTQKQIQKEEGRLFKNIRKIVTSEICPSDNSQSASLLRLYILNTARHAPDRLGSADFAEKAAVACSDGFSREDLVEKLDKLHTLYFMDKNIFCQTMQKYHKGLADSVSRPKNKNIAPFRGIER